MPINDQKLSTNFWLRELVKSTTAARLGIDNWPTEQETVDNLTKIAYNILQPVRDHYGIPFSPSSGYRCLKLNRALKSTDRSKHRFGQAVDLEVSGISNYDLAVWIRDNLEHDKVILEFYTQGIPTSGWVHVQYMSPETNRRTTWTIGKGGTFKGLLR